MHDGKDVAILSIGPIGNNVENAIKKYNETENNALSIAHYDMRFLKPLDDNLLHEIGKKFKHIITIEDGVRNGGFGSSILEWMSDNGYNPKITRLGVQDSFIEHGPVDELQKICHIDPDSIIDTIKSLR